MVRLTRRVPLSVMDLLPIFATIATISGGLGIAYAVFTAAKVQSTISLYKEENAAQGKRITTLGTDVAVAKEQLVNVRRENDMLKDLATGTTALGKLADAFTREERQRHEEHQRMTQVLEGIVQHLKGGAS